MGTGVPTDGGTTAGPSTIEFLSAPQESDFPDEWYGLTSTEHFWFRWRLEALLGQLSDLSLPLQRPLRVLDIGAGTGVLRDQLEAATAWHVDIADLNKAALAGARQGRGRNLCYDVKEAAKTLVESYDVVLLFDVLEHISETGPFLQRVVQHLKPDGWLLLNVPACPSLFSVYDEAAGHVRRYNKSTLAAEFSRTGLQLVDIRYWGLLLLPLLVARKALLRRMDTKGDTVRHGFRPPGRLAQGLLRMLLRTERALVPRPFHGTSLLLAGRKTVASQGPN